MKELKGKFKYKFEKNRKITINVAIKSTYPIIYRRLVQTAVSRLPCHINRSDIIIPALNK